MKRMLLISGAALLLAGCMSPYGWGDDGYYGGGYGSAPYYGGGYGGGYYGAPVGWWGSNAASIDLFYGLLGGYGSWMPYGNYGQVFIPSNMGAGWQPYSRGSWQRDSRYGQMWMSSDPFGWATDHYGRWGHDNRLGWFWVPGTQFGPGWVDWKSDNGRRAWAPTPPRGFTSGSSARRFITTPVAGSGVIRGRPGVGTRRTVAGQVPNGSIGRRAGTDFDRSNGSRVPQAGGQRRFGWQAGQADGSAPRAVVVPGANMAGRSRTITTPAPGTDGQTRGDRQWRGRTTTTPDAAGNNWRSRQNAARARRQSRSDESTPRQAWTSGNRQWQSRRSDNNWSAGDNGQARPAQRSWRRR